MIQRMFGHPAAAILRAIEAFARVESSDREKPIMIVENTQSTDWASLTFVGQRHVFDLRFEGEGAVVTAALAHLRANIGDIDIPLAGHFVADIGVEADTEVAPTPEDGCGRLRIAALSIRD
jgi:hypothetical protein